MDLSSSNKSYIFSKESFSYIFSNETLHVSPQARKVKEIHPGKISHTSGNRNPEKISSVSGNENSKKASYISGGNLQSLKTKNFL